MPLPKYDGLIKQSRTLDLAALTAIVGTLVVTLPQLQAIITPEVYGIAFVVLSVVQAWLRSKTTTPIGQKNKPPAQVSGETGGLN
jgi:hypothetical protein